MPLPFFLVQQYQIQYSRGGPLYRGLKKGQISLGSISYEVECSPKNFWHLFHQNWAKNEKVSLQKNLVLDDWSLKITIWVLYPFLPVLKLYMFSRSRNPFLRFRRIRKFCFQKKKSFVILGREDAFVDALNFLQFWCFVNAEWKIDPAEGFLKISAPNSFLYGRGTNLFAFRTFSIEMCMNETSLTPVKTNSSLQFCFILTWLPLPNK